jgi:hypothetical protein
MGGDLSRQIYKKLEFLGKTPMEVALKLKQLGVKGNRYCCRTCPLSQWLQSLFSKNVDISVSAFAVHYSQKNESGSVDMPKACTKFVAGFDEGAFQELCFCPNPKEPPF